MIYSGLLSYALKLVSSLEDWAFEAADGPRYVSEGVAHA